jgi:hypothetical protein
MTEPTVFERAIENAKSMAHSLGVRVFLYRNAAGNPVFLTMSPADTSEVLELVAIFEPPPPTVYEGMVPT